MAVEGSKQVIIAENSQLWFENNCWLSRTGHSFLITKQWMKYLFLEQIWNSEHVYDDAKHIKCTWCRHIHTWSSKKIPKLFTPIYCVHTAHCAQPSCQYLKRNKKTYCNCPNNAFNIVWARFPHHCLLQPTTFL